MTLKTQGSVRVVGAGLLGTSIGLALSKLGVDVIITDASPAASALAIDYGAGRAPQENDQPNLIVVCVPPDITATLVAAELQSNPDAIVTEVASVKAAILKQLRDAGADLSRYVGSHPMAGRERGGAIAGRADLFIGRTWVLSATDESSPAAVTAVENLASDLGSAIVSVAATEHDHAVALVSHLPQMVASLTAGQLIEADASDIQLAGQGLRDTIRIAASDPKLWVQILAANAPLVADALKGLARDLDSAICALENVSASGSLAKLSTLLEAGNQGISRLPGKHGAKATNYSGVTVMIDDKPGELGRLFAEVGEIGVNLEEINLEHSPASLVGMLELSVMPGVESHLITELTSRGWRLVG